MKYDIERAVVTLSVTELCELALCGGDLDLRPGKGMRFSPERAVLGAQIHRKLQSEAGAQYDAEVSLCNTTLYREIAYEINGRADGILRTDPPTVDEIKTVGKRAFDLPPLPQYDAQLKCYAYFLCRERGLTEVQTRLTYYNTETEELRYFTERHSSAELREFYVDLLSRVEYRAQILRERATVRIPSAKSGRFPYPSVREGQDIMIRECYRDIKAGKRLFVEAPTGTGKTLSSLYPAVRALGDGLCDKIFYLTAKAATRREAFRAAAQLFEAGAHLRTVVLTAREQLCPNAAACADPLGISAHCNPVDCPLARGFYDRCNHAVCAALGKHNGFVRSSIEEIAKDYEICPYEFQLALSEMCDIIICDYNYAFDPHVYLRRYFDAEGLEQNRYVFLIDEAHNLGDRARDMYSADLKNTDVINAIKALPQSEEKLCDNLRKLAVTMQGFRRLCRDNLYKDSREIKRGYYISRNPLESFHKLVSEVRPMLDGWLRLRREGEGVSEARRLSSALRHFETVAECYDPCFLTFIELEGNTRTLRLICLDPSRVLDACLGRAVSSVLFSATLTPPDYFADILGGGKNAVRISLPAPFDPANFCPVAVTSVSTRYEDREKSYKRIASLIAATVSAKAGNYIVYFPSYQYMEEVLKIFSAKYPQVTTVVQRRNMTVAERESFLDSFAEDRKLRVGFCVLGGSFSEGIDLPGSRLIGSVIVGTGLPGISNERNILKEYYDTTRERGFDYAYVYPGMNRVLQAAGRVIRREEDRGVVVLIDDRYGEERTAMLLPEHWNHLQYAGSSSELAEIAKDFWQK